VGFSGADERELQFEPQRPRLRCLLGGSAKQGMRPVVKIRFGYILNLPCIRPGASKKVVTITQQAIQVIQSSYIIGPSAEQAANSEPVLC